MVWRRVSRKCTMATEIQQCLDTFTVGRQRCCIAIIENKRGSASLEQKLTPVLTHPAQLAIHAIPPYLKQEHFTISGILRLITPHGLFNICGSLAPQILMVRWCSIFVLYMFGSMEIPKVYRSKKRSNYHTKVFHLWLWWFHHNLSPAYR